ncbi:unnamed protein product [Ectocarpus sp. 4 AP-2014]
MPFTTDVLLATSRGRGDSVRLRSFVLFVWGEYLTDRSSDGIAFVMSLLWWVVVVLDPEVLTRSRACLRGGMMWAGYGVIDEHLENAALFLERWCTYHLSLRITW